MQENVKLARKEMEIQGCKERAPHQRDVRKLTMDLAEWSSQATLKKTILGAKCE